MVLFANKTLNCYDKSVYCYRIVCVGAGAYYRVLQALELDA